MSFFNNKGNGSGNGNGSSVEKPQITKKFIATANQKTFTPVGSVGRLLRVIVGSVEQFPPEGFSTGANGSFTLSEDVIVGTDVVAIYSGT